MRVLSNLSLGVALSALVLAAAIAATPAAADSWRHHHRGYWGPAAAVGVIGFAAGAIIASQTPAYADDGCVRYRPVYDRYGRYVGDRAVDVCD